MQPLHGALSATMSPLPHAEGPLAPTTESCTHHRDPHDSMEWAHCEGILDEPAPPLSGSPSTACAHQGPQAASSQARKPW